MRKITFIAILTMMVGLAHAQTDTLQLQGMTKVALADVYLKEVQRVSQKMALTAFDTVSHSVPSTPYTQKKFTKVDRRMKEYCDILIQQYMEIIPYADKKEIIDSIVYLRGL